MHQLNQQIMCNCHVRSIIWSKCFIRVLTALLECLVLVPRNKFQRLLLFLSDCYDSIHILLCKLKLGVAMTLGVPQAVTLPAIENIENSMQLWLERYQDKIRRYAHGYCVLYSLNSIYCASNIHSYYIVALWLQSLPQCLTFAR